MNGFERDALVTLVGRVGTDLVGAELGVFQGGTSERLLRECQIKKLYMVDPYTPGAISHWSKRNKPRKHSCNKRFRRVKRRFEKEFGTRVKIIRSKSVPAAKHVDQMLDFVFIDGDHSYSGVMGDLSTWTPLIREGGLIAGHDWTRSAPGVAKAVKEFAGLSGVFQEPNDDNSDLGFACEKRPAGGQPIVHRMATGCLWWAFKKTG